MNDYGIVPNTENLPGIPARVTAVHQEEMLRRKQEWRKGLSKFTKQRNKEIW